ncbi:dehydrodolichyl diphosphate synthase complex subunit Nus1 [Anthonomus grandis grandis]|uniref:dehydrodolichyl diphosphate synthase complex subunit Nus1 n=1 Tax=Anthonomus grandis grandis TaxID=2921223 RepID=UPI002165A49F|nr:dehydrodolichyl diphosphate synthase complex subunit Nus1 [Anthonomus grandis grandis]
MNYNIIYRAFYVLLHAVFTLLEATFAVLQRFCAAFVDFNHEFWGAQEVEYLKKQIEKGNKIPKHLTVLLGKEEHSHKDLANLISWCLKHEIIYLSFYDNTGNLKKNQDKLEKLLAQRIQPEDHIIWHPNFTFKNGFVGRKIHIKVFSKEDGKDEVANLTRSMCTKLADQQISINLIDEQLQRRYEFPDPDLALYCGQFLMFCGYPPWQIRVTEFLSIKTHHRIKYKTFLKKLCVYGKCEQRLGK